MWLILFGLAIWLGASFILGVIVGKAFCRMNSTDSRPPRRHRAF